MGLKFSTLRAKLEAGWKTAEMKASEHSPEVGRETPERTQKTAFSAEQDKRDKEPGYVWGMKGREMERW